MEKINELEYLKSIFGKEKVITINELKGRMQVSEITIRRKLKKSKAITSYNKNGMYYTLPHFPKFNSDGLWNYKDIRFSRYGNLNQTIIQLINLSSGGLDAEKIGELISYSPHSLLHQLFTKSAIHREKLEGRYIYFSADTDLFKLQLNECISLQSQYNDEEISCYVAVRLLVEIIRHPKETLLQIVGILHDENIKISELQAKRFLEKYGIEKKTNFL